MLAQSVKGSALAKAFSALHIPNYDMKMPNLVSPAEAVQCIKSGDRVWGHSVAGTPTPLLKALADRSPEYTGTTSYTVRSARVVGRTVAMSVSGIEWALRDVGHAAYGRSALAYIGPLSQDGESPSHTMTQGEGEREGERDHYTLRPREQYSTLIVGRNATNESDHSIVVSESIGESGRVGLAHRVIPCPIPTITHHSTATRIGDSVYLFGGDTESSHLSDLYCYCISEGVWREVQTEGQWPRDRWGEAERNQWPGGRGYHSAFTLGGRLYIAGGFDGSRALRDCWCYDPDNQVPDAPLPFYFSTSVVIGDTAHLFGSVDNPSMHLSYSEDGGWVTEADLPFEVYSASTLSIGTDIVVLGGYHHETKVHVYNTLTKSWREQAELPVPIKWGRACHLTPHNIVVHSEQGSGSAAMGTDAQIGSLLIEPQTNTDVAMGSGQGAVKINTEARGDTIIGGDFYLTNNGVTALAITQVENTSDSYSAKEEAETEMVIAVPVTFTGDVEFTGAVAIDAFTELELTTITGKDGGALAIDATAVNMSDDLNVGGDVSVTGTLSVSGVTTLDSLTVTGATSFATGLSVSAGQDTDLGGDLTVAGTTTLNDAVTVATDKATSLGGTLTVVGDKATTLGGDLTVAGNLTVAGTTTLNDAVTVATDKATSLGGTLTVVGDKATTLGGDLTVAGTLTLNDGVTVATDKTTTLNGALTVASGKATTLGGNLTVSGTTTLNDAVTVATDKATSLGGTLTVVGDKATTLGGDLTVSGTTTLNDNVTVATDKTTTLNGALNVATGKATSLGGTLTVTGTTSLLGTTVTSLAMGTAYSLPTTDGTADQTLTTDGSGTVAWSDITYTGGNTFTSITVNNASTLNGAVTVAADKATSLGGTLSVSKAATLSDDLDVSGDTEVEALTVNGLSVFKDNISVDASKTTTLGGTLSVTGAATLSSTLGVTGAATVGSTLGVTGDTTLSGGLSVAASQITSLGGTLSVAGTSTLAGNVSVTGPATTSLGGTLTVTGATTLNNSLTVTSSATSLGGTLTVTGNSTLNGTLGVATGMATTLGGSLAATSLTGTLAVTGTSTLGGNLTVTGPATTTLGGTLTVTGATTLSSTLAVSSNASITGTLGVTGAATLSSTLSVSSNATIGGTLGVTGKSTLAALDAGNTAITGTVPEVSLVLLFTLTPGTLSATGNVSGADASFDKVTTDAFTMGVDSTEYSLPTAAGANGQIMTMNTATSALEWNNAGNTFSLTAAGAITAGLPVFLNDDGSATISTGATIATDPTYLGIAIADCPDGDMAYVTTTGGTSTVHSGLTPGKKYYVQDDGALHLRDTTEDQLFVGVALSATSMLVLLFGEATAGWGSA
ncbi:hypothetical protein KIPB_000932 [Kipferlia bialata]|uniref:Uncharacterized protein n=1 Tax=Kipferlia bialata TaxID=797122 RepID=A0A9K3GF61_9EUKA|nr:hypothetical protein KIPB_000932 [Kipferlia bialata]|eukprot:g932.t1